MVFILKKMGKINIAYFKNFQTQGATWLIFFFWGEGGNLISKLAQPLKFSGKVPTNHLLDIENISSHQKFLKFSLHHSYMLSYVLWDCFAHNVCLNVWRYIFKVLENIIKDGLWFNLDFIKVYIIVFSFEINWLNYVIIPRRNFFVQRKCNK